MSPPQTLEAMMQDFDEGNFKSGGKGKVVGVVALLAALGGGAAFFLTQGGPAETELTVPQAAETMKGIFVRPKEEQLAEWRKWAATPGEKGGMSEIKQEAIKQLAWAKDPEGVKLATELLKSPEPKLQGMAATALMHYGSPLADAAKPALVEALKTAGEGSKPQIAWALVTLGEASAFEPILQLYRLGHLASVQRLGGGMAFDPNKIIALIPLERVAGLSKDESPAVRQLVATVLSRNADPKWTDTLIQLLGDSDAEVARQAAPGLGMIGDQKARDPLISKLKDADKDSRAKYLDAIRNGSGGQGLVLALYAFTNESNVETKWFRRKEILGLIDELNDPRAADALYEYLQTEQDIHWRYRVARAMAQVGDARSIPELAKRLRMDPAKVYSDEYDWEMELKRDDKERVEAARMIADVVRLHPDKAEQFRAQAEDAIIFWMHEMPSPHANALRALAAMGSTKDVEALRKWSNPDVPLPKEGQQPPMPEEFVIAQSALRYIGMLKDQSSYKVLLESLKKRPEKLRIDNEGMYQGGLAILGMALNALGKGASDGLSEWGDNKAFEPLLKYATDVNENENSRMSACSALAWTADAEGLIKVAEKIGEFSKQTPEDSARRKCLLETLVQKPVPGTASALLALLAEDTALDTRPNVARAIAKSGLDAASEAKLFELAKNENLMGPAVLALILGGSPESAVAMYADKGKVAVEELQDLWARSFGFWSTADLETGLLFKYVDNAIEMSHVTINATPQEWATGLLEREFEKLTFDNGPHSFTRVILRNTLYQMANGSDAQKALGAVKTLKFLKEQGVLMALRGVSGEVGKAAEEAVFELINPKVLQGVKPADPDEKK
jgi:HEAT repeat protein